MTDVLSGRAIHPRVSLEVIRRRLPALALLAAFVVLSALVIPRLDATGSATVTPYELDSSKPVPRVRLHGLTRNVYGFVASPFGSGTASFGVPAPPSNLGDRTVLLITAGQADAPTRVTLVDRSGRRHLLGTARAWRAHEVNVSGIRLGGRRSRLAFAATSESPVARLVADRVVIATYPPSAIPEAGRWEVAAWAALGVLAVLALLGRLRRDLLLVGATGLTAWLVWPSIVSSALAPLPSDVWLPATHASWLGLDHGLLSGTFGAASALSVQLFHVLGPITGTGAAGARVASMLVGVLAVVAIYALGRRVAGLVGAGAAVTLALICDPFRDSLSSGNSDAVLVLASCLFLLAMHRVLVKGDLLSLALLGATGAIAMLADATWWPGLVASLVLLALWFAREASPRLRLAVALGVFVLVALPARVSILDQGGNLTSDVTLRTTYARNAEFAGRGHGAPPDSATLAAAPYSGPRVGLGSYVFGDHSLPVVADGTVSGAYHALGSAGARPATKIVGLLAFLLELAGLAYLLILPRLRLFVLIPALLSLVPWFLSDRTDNHPFVTVAGFWPAMLLGGAALVYAGSQLAAPRVRASGLVSALRARGAALLSERPRVPHAG